MFLIWSIDLESFVTAQKYNNLTTYERKLLDNGAIVWQVKQLLHFLKKYNSKLTWFVTSEIFEWYPELLFQIQCEGHEIGWHTHTHMILKKGEDVKEEIRKAEKFIEVFKPKGFQSPAIIFPESGYCLLKEHGFVYSSSVYGQSDKITNIDGILEIPVSSIRLKKNANNTNTFKYNRSFVEAVKDVEFPIGSSFFTGLLRFHIIRRIIINMKDSNKSLCFFMHNWQIFSEGKNAWISRIMESINNPLFIPYLLPARKIYGRLLSEFNFISYQEMLQQELK